MNRLCGLGGSAVQSKKRGPVNRGPPSFYRLSDQPTAGASAAGSSGGQATAASTIR